MWYIYSMEYYLVMEKNDMNAISSNTEAARDYPAKWSKSERERQIYDITYMWNLNYGTNEFIYEASNSPNAY